MENQSQRLLPIKHVAFLADIKLAYHSGENTGQKLTSFKKLLWNEFRDQGVMKKLFAKLDKWAAKHHPRWIDSLRISLGVLIHLKALLFIDATAELVRTLEIYNLGINTKLLVYSIGTINLVVGTFIMLGLKTRIMILIQFPIVIISVVYSLIHMSGNFLFAEVLLSAIIILLLLFFFAEGSGKFSVDEYFKNSFKTYTPDTK